MRSGGRPIRDVEGEAHGEGIFDLLARRAGGEGQAHVVRGGGRLGHPVTMIGERAW